MAMIVAETLGLNAEDVNPSVPDTSSIGMTAGTGGSRTTYATGHACYKAAEEIKTEMCLRAAQLLEIQESDVCYENGNFVCISDKNKILTFEEIAAEQASTGGPITGTGTINASGPQNAFGTHIVDVEVDPDTDKTDILRFTAIQDVGKAIHPSYVEGQIQGASVQGIGWALNEEYFYGEEGQMLNSSFLDYRMPTSLDLPMIDTVIVEVENPGHPMGVRGVGEVSLVPPMAAVANAIADAVDIRPNQLPMNPNVVLTSILEK